MILDLLVNPRISGLGVENILRVEYHILGIMKEYDYFEKIFNLMKIEDRLTLFLLIWKQGELKTELKKKMMLEDPTLLDTIAKEFSKLGFLSIEEYRGENIFKGDSYYYISDVNLKNILQHICHTCNYPLDNNIIELLQIDKNNYTDELIAIAQHRLYGNDLRDKILLLLIERSISLFFLFILEFSKSFKEYEERRILFNNYLLHSLLNTTVRTIKLEILEKEYKEKSIKEPDEDTVFIQPKNQNLV